MTTIHTWLYFLHFDNLYRNSLNIVLKKTCWHPQFVSYCYRSATRYLHHAAFFNSITHLNSNVITLITSISVRAVSKCVKYSYDPRLRDFIADVLHCHIRRHIIYTNQEFLSKCTGNSSIPYDDNSDQLNS